MRLSCTAIRYADAADLPLIEAIEVAADERFVAVSEQVFMFSLSAWDANCPQHIPKRVDLAQLEAVVAAKDRTIL